jgi:hypothetical protein
VWPLGNICAVSSLGFSRPATMRCNSNPYYLAIGAAVRDGDAPVEQYSWRQVG